MNDTLQGMYLYGRNERALPALLFKVAVDNRNPPTTCEKERKYILCLHTSSKFFKNRFMLTLPVPRYPTSHPHHHIWPVTWRGHWNNACLPVPQKSNFDILDKVKNLWMITLAFILLTLGVTFLIRIPSADFWEYSHFYLTCNMEGRQYAKIPTHA